MIFKIISQLVNPVKFGLALVLLPFLYLLKLVNPKLHLRVMTTNHQFFGHLALEPEKYLSALDSLNSLYEIEFNGEKRWENISRGSEALIGPNTLTLWNLGKISKTKNEQLFKMWKRTINVLPSFIAGTLLRAGRISRISNISEYQFSSLLSADRYLDLSPAHLEFLATELNQAQIELKNIGIDPNKPWVCFIVRNQNETDTESALRSRQVQDFVLAAQHLVQHGVQVVRMGASKTVPFGVDHELVIDYANSVHRTALLDIFLLGKCAFAVSTLSGPVAVCMAFRRPVLYIDLANYALCFSGTKLTTWTPALIRRESSGELLSLIEVFNCGAGWFWKDSQFREAGLRVERSSPDEIAQYVSAMYNKLILNKTQKSSDVQMKYQASIQQAMGDLGEQWHGKIGSFLSEPFLSKHGIWFLS